MPEIVTAETDADIAATWPVMHQLRPHLSLEAYVPMARRMMDREGYRLASVVDDGTIRAVAGYRFIEMLYCGRILVVDDLVTDEVARSGGHGKRLLDHLRAVAREAGCTQVHLDSNVRREGAHRFYFREGFHIMGFHFVGEE